MVSLTGQKGPELQHAPLTAIQLSKETQTFVNCMQQMQTDDYFEIVYVKVIFLHVGCCYFVFR